jgi:hypothetical protein
MAQHFLLSAKCRNFSRSQLNALTDEEQIALMARLRWGPNGEQVCPACKLAAKHHWRANRQQWRCRDQACRRDFSVTSGTIFHGHKLSVREILTAIYTFVNSTKSVSAAALARELGCQWKTAWLLTQKIREMLLKSNDYETLLKGTVEMDGGFFCGRYRAPNIHGTHRDERAIADKIENRRPMAYKRWQQVSAKGAFDEQRKKKSRCVLVAREKSEKKGEGATRTLIYVTRTEDRREIMWFATRHIAAGTTIMTDEGIAFNELSRLFHHKTVKHKRRYVGVDGTNNNQAESFNSRLRRAQYGTHHGFRPKFLMDYAVESAWREDSRKASMLDRFEGLLCEVLRMGRSMWFGKYFQGMRRIEIQGVADGRRFTGPNAEEVAMDRDEIQRRQQLHGTPLIARGSVP